MTTPITASNSVGMGSGVGLAAIVTASFPEGSALRTPLLLAAPAVSLFVREGISWLQEFLDRRRKAKDRQEDETQRRETAQEIDALVESLNARLERAVANKLSHIDEVRGALVEAERLQTRSQLARVTALTTTDG